MEEKLSKAEIRAWREVRGHLKRWRDILCIPIGYTIELQLADLEGEAHMEVDVDLAKNDIYKIRVDRGELREDRAGDRECTMVHELMHIVAYDLVRLAEAVVPDNLKDEVEYREEQLVDRMARILTSLA